MAVAVMTDSRGLQLDDAVTDHVALRAGRRLQNLLDRGGFKRLVREPVSLDG